jgi:hypothetical protein
MPNLTGVPAARVWRPALLIVATAAAALALAAGLAIVPAGVLLGWLALGMAAGYALSGST